MVNIEQFNTYKDLNDYLYFTFRMNALIELYRTSSDKNTYEKLLQNIKRYNSEFDELIEIRNNIMNQTLENRKVLDIIITSLNSSKNKEGFNVILAKSPYSTEDIIELNTDELYTDKYNNIDNGYILMANKNITSKQVVDYFKDNNSKFDNGKIICYDEFSNETFNDYLNHETMCDYFYFFLNFDVDTINNINESLFLEYKNSKNKSKKLSKTK